MRARLRAGQWQLSPAAARGSPMGFGEPGGEGCPLPQPSPRGLHGWLEKLMLGGGATCRAAAGHPRAVPAAMLRKGLGEIPEETRSSRGSFSRGHPCWRCAWHPYKYQRISLQQGNTCPRMTVTVTNSHPQLYGLIW